VRDGHRKGGGGDAIRSNKGKEEPKRLRCNRDESEPGSRTHLVIKKGEGIEKFTSLLKGRE